MEQHNQSEQSRLMAERQIGVLTSTVDTVLKARNPPVAPTPTGPARILAVQGERLMETPTETGDSAYAFTVMLDDDPKQMGYRTWTWQHDSKAVHQVSARNQEPEAHEEITDPADIAIVQGRIATFINALPEQAPAKKSVGSRFAAALGKLIIRD